LTPQALRLRCQFPHRAPQVVDPARAPGQAPRRAPASAPSLVHPVSKFLARPHALGRPVRHPAKRMARRPALASVQSQAPGPPPTHQTVYRDLEGYRRRPFSRQLLVRYRHTPQRCRPSCTFGHPAGRSDTRTVRWRRERTWRPDSRRRNRSETPRKDKKPQRTIWSPCGPWSPHFGFTATGTELHPLRHFEPWSEQPGASSFALGWPQIFHASAESSDATCAPCGKPVPSLKRT
jgi:hypothetical protein